MSIKTCTIKLLNKTFDIKCEASEEEHLLLAAQKLDEQMAQQKTRFKHLDSFQTLLMASLNISHELIKSQNEQEKQRLQVNQFINSLEDKINKVVTGEVSN